MDTKFQLPKFNGQTNGEAVDSWIRSLSTYFTTCQGLNEARRLQIASLQLEGLAQTWWATEQEKAALAELGDAPQLANTTPIKTWNQFAEALRNRFYPLGYIQSMWIRWHQMHQLPTQQVQQYIEHFSKLRLLLHV